MKKQSFRSLITISLILVISTISFFAFRIYSHYLEKRIYTDSETNIISSLAALNLLKDQIYYSRDEHDGRIIDTLVTRMDGNNLVRNLYLFDAEGKLQHFLNKDSTGTPSLPVEELAASENRVSIQSFPRRKSPFTRAYIRMYNSPLCYDCHAQKQDVLGYFVVELSMAEARSKINYIRRSSLLFTLTMVIVIVLFILFMHYRFIRKSLREFNQTIDAVNKGDLEKRILIPETKELGKLGKNFNEMLDSFYLTQSELRDFHQKELRSNYKLATIGEMAARLAHEIRNPITGIENAIEIIVKETNDEQNIPIFEEIQRQAGRANNAITSLLKFSRKKELNLIINNINELIEQLVFFLKNQVKEKKIHFELDLQDDIPHFRFDPEQMEDVLLNLGLNAIQSIGQEGKITMGTRYSSRESTLKIFISDTGTGIPEDKLPNIFHPFFTTRHEGTGLGLSIVKDIVQNHQGEIWAENNPGKGATFSISIPLNL